MVAAMVRVIKAVSVLASHAAWCYIEMTRITIAVRHS